jgi:hypothetical protein
MVRIWGTDAALEMLRTVIETELSQDQITWPGVPVINK